MIIRWGEFFASRVAKVYQQQSTPSFDSCATP
jgi:hypothetical protein